MSDFELAVKTAAEKAVLKIIGDGSWVMPDYANRVKLPSGFLEEVWKMVDQAKVKEQMTNRIEQELANRVVNAMAAELATDIKQLLSVSERREAIRAIAREHLEEIMGAGK